MMLFINPSEEENFSKKDDGWGGGEREICLHFDFIFDFIFDFWFFFEGVGLLFLPIEESGDFNEGGKKKKIFVVLVVGSN